jgi:hypothetical protein
MNRSTSMSALACCSILLCACGGGGDSGASKQSSTGVTAGPTVTPAPASPPVETKPDFTTYLSTMVASGESEDPAATDDLEFVFTDDDNDAVFAAVLEMM